jgi:hypothetical protein
MRVGRCLVTAAILLRIYEPVIVVLLSVSRSLPINGAVCHNTVYSHHSENIKRNIDMVFYTKITSQIDGVLFWFNWYNLKEVGRTQSV